MVEDFTDESVASVCRQEIDAYEIIIVDDGTKDNSIERAVAVIKDYR
jgi:glycosyltransferase involved in cell wall biosynthesis